MRYKTLSVPSVALLWALSLPARAQTPYLVKDLDPAGSGLSGVIGAAGDRMVFVGSDGSPGGQGLWATEGTANSTQLIAPGLSLDAFTSFTLDDALVGSKFGQPDGLWRTDGSIEGTRKISAIPNTGANTGFWLPVQHGLGMFIGTYNSAGDRKPFVTDGTAQGTVAVPKPLDAFSDHFFASLAMPYDRFHGGFAVANSDPLPLGGLWLYDPSTHRTTRLFSSIARDFVTSVRTVDERLFVNCGDLCVTDGTASGTSVIDVPALGVFPIYAVDGLAYFWADGALWRSDGTTTGTVPMASIAPVLAGLESNGVAVVSGSILYFAATNAATGRELWRTDGTAAGTFMLKDIDPGPGSGCAEFSHCQSVPVAGGLVFWASTPATGLELWKTDGTSAGTVPLPEIVPGPAPTLPYLLRRAGSRVYFGADDGVHGLELWAIDLPPGAVAVEDAGAVGEGDGPGTTVTFTVRLESPAPQPVVVSYTTVAGTAQAGSDFVPTAGTLTFAPGEREASVEVSIVADGTPERAESFRLAVTTVTGAPVADGSAVAVILDDDGPRVGVAGATVVEGDSGTTNASFAVTLTTDDGQGAPVPITVRAVVVPDTAGEADFPPTPLPPTGPIGVTVTFPAGTASGTTLPLLVPVLGDTLEEPNETFSLALDAGNDAVLPDLAPIGVILDDDGIAANPPVEIAHGSRITADLASPAGRTSDVDFYVLRHDLHSSYEIVVDAVSGDGAPLLVERVVADGGVFQTAQPTGTGNSVALRFPGLGTATDHIRVRAKDCGPSCGADDTYRLRMYETTLRAPRVNTTGTQSTALVLQNTTGAPVQAVAAFWSDGGSLAGLHLANVAPHGTTVVDLGTVVPPFAGSLTVGHDAPYGTLVGKVVSADPSTGIAFDTPLTPRPR